MWRSESKLLHLSRYRSTGTDGAPSPDVGVADGAPPDAGVAPVETAITSVEGTI